MADAPEPAPWVRSLGRVHELIGRAERAVESEDWPTAITAVEEAVKQVEDAQRRVINLARTVGKLTDQEVGSLRGTSAEAVIKRFGAKRDLLSDAARAQWDAERQRNAGSSSSEE